MADICVCYFCVRLWYNSSGLIVVFCFEKFIVCYNIGCEEGVKDSGIFGVV